MEKNLTLSEIEKQKIALSDGIKTLIEQYHEATGLFPNSISLELIDLSTKESRLTMLGDVVVHQYI